MTASNNTFHELVANTQVECAEMDPAYWFADPHDEDEKFGTSEQAIARAVCKRCPIVYECFKYAVDNNIEEGIWGGAVPQQRQAYRLRVSLSTKPLTGGQVDLGA